MAAKAFLFLSAFMLFLTTLNANAYAPHPVPALSLPLKVAPALPPQVAHHRNHGTCVARCRIYCNSFHSQRSCSRSCVPCCDVLNCVPGPTTRCDAWSKVVYYGRDYNCPKIYVHSPK